MSLGKRLLASGALGASSGLIIAIGVVAMLSAPAHAEPPRSAATFSHPLSIARETSASPAASAWLDGFSFPA